MKGSTVIVHEGQRYEYSYSDGYHPLVEHVLNQFGISNQFLLYSNGKPFDYQDQLSPGEYYTRKKPLDNNSDIQIIVKRKGFSCRCGSFKYKFRGLDDYNHGPIEASTFIHVMCVKCGKHHGLLGNADDWMIYR